MARVFTEAGIPSRALSGQTPLAERAEAAAALRHQEIRCLFTVDLFNEGVDLPDVDTLLLLRPTSSATVFLQQLGRGLRRAPGRPYSPFWTSSGNTAASTGSTCATER